MDRPLRERPGCAIRPMPGPGSRGVARAVASPTARRMAPRSAMRAVLRRIRALAVPPAWTDVWICPDPDGHLQATGRDARGRKQYRYHVRWRTGRDDAKFERLLEFARVLPRIRRRCDRDLARRDLTREKVLAAVITTPRADPHPGRQRGIRAAQSVVRPDDDEEPPRTRRGDGSRLPLQRQVRPASRGRTA